MTGNHIMLRPLQNNEVRQRTKDSFICLNDLQVIARKQRFAQGLSERQPEHYFALDSTSEFIEALKSAENITTVKTSALGRNGGTWVHPLLALDFILWASPELKVAVYKWVTDSLMTKRVGSSDSFKAMNVALDKRYNIGAKYWFYTNAANLIRHRCGVTDWAHATEDQLAMRDKMQQNVILLCENTSTMPFDNLIHAATK